MVYDIGLRSEVTGTVLYIVVLQINTLKSVYSKHLIFFAID